MKADNILLEPSGICKISDFGISKQIEDIQDQRAFTGMRGTVQWMAPEIVDPKKGGYDAKVDIWSVGCVVLEMWSGEQPWSGESIISVMFKARAPGLNVIVATLTYITAITTQASASRACHRTARTFSGRIQTPVFRIARICSKSSRYCLLISGTAILETDRARLSSESTSIFDCRLIGNFLMSCMIATPIANRKQNPL